MAGNLRVVGMRDILVLTKYLNWTNNDLTETDLLNEKYEQTVKRAVIFFGIDPEGKLEYSANIYRDITGEVSLGVRVVGVAIKGYVLRGMIERVISANIDDSSLAYEMLKMLNISVNLKDTPQPTQKSKKEDISYYVEGWEKSEEAVNALQKIIAEIKPNNVSVY